MRPRFALFAALLAATASAGGCMEGCGGCACERPRLGEQAGAQRAATPTPLVARGPVLVTANRGLGVSQQDLDREVAREALNQRRDKATFTDAERRNLLERLAREEALLQEALSRGLHRHPLLRKRIVNELITTEVLPKVEPKQIEPADVQAWYEQHREDFRKALRVQVAQIYFRGDPRQPESAVSRKGRTNAMVAAEQARQDPARFAELVKQHSEAPASEKEQDGLVGWLDPQFVPGELYPAVKDARAGDIVGPVESAIGYHVLKVLEVSPSHVPPLSEIEPHVKHALIQSRIGQHRERLEHDLMRKYGIEMPAASP